ARRHITRRPIGVVLHLAPSGILAVDGELHPDGQRSERHLNEIAGVIDGFRQRSRQDDKLASVRRWDVRRSNNAVTMGLRTIAIGMAVPTEQTFEHAHASREE